MLIFDTIWILFFNILSWVFLLNDCLERRSPHIIAKIVLHIIFVSFRKAFNAFELIFFIQHFCDTCILHVFEFHRYGHRGRFFCNNDEKSMQQFYVNKEGLIFFKNEKLFLSNFEKLPITSDVSWIPDTGCFKICLQYNRLYNPSPADYLATLFSTLFNFSALAFPCSYLKSNIYTCCKFFYIFQNYDKGVISVCCSNYHIILSYWISNVKNIYLSSYSWLRHIHVPSVFVMIKIKEGDTSVIYTKSRVL